MENWHYCGVGFFGNVEKRDAVVYANEHVVSEWIWRSKRGDVKRFQNDALECGFVVLFWKRIVEAISVSVGY